MLRHPLGDVKHTCLKRLKGFGWRLPQITEKQGETGACFFHRCFIFYLNFFFLCMENPLRTYSGAGRFFLSSLKESFGEFLSGERGLRRTEGKGYGQTKLNCGHHLAERLPKYQSKYFEKYRFFSLSK